MSNNNNQSGFQLSSETLSALIELIKELKKSSENDETEIHKCICDNCGREDFKNYRYKCLICDDYDLCSRCFENKFINKNHENGHPIVRFHEPSKLFGDTFSSSEINLKSLANKYKNEVHENIKCDSCGLDSIVGLRFKCESCKNYDFCLKCYLNKKIAHSHKLNHSIIVLGKTAVSRINPDELELKDQLGHGYFGAVYKANYQNKRVACKIIQYHPVMLLLGKDPKTLLNSYVDEIRAYNEIKGINILRFLGHYEEIDSEKNTFKLYILTEFMEKGSLSDVIKNEKELSF